MPWQIVISGEAAAEAEAEVLHWFGQILGHLRDTLGPRGLQEIRFGGESGTVSLHPQEAPAAAPPPADQAPATPAPPATDQGPAPAPPPPPEGSAPAPPAA